jgi:hypothetical protein
VAGRVASAVGRWVGKGVTEEDGVGVIVAVAEAVPEGVGVGVGDWVGAGVFVAGRVGAAVDDLVRAGV